MAISLLYSFNKRTLLLSTLYLIKMFYNIILLQKVFFKVNYFPIKRIIKKINKKILLQDSLILLHIKL